MGIQGYRSLELNAKKSQVPETKFYKVPGPVGVKGPWNPQKVLGPQIEKVPGL